MTKDQLESLILSNLALQFAQHVAIYTGIDGNDVAAANAARQELHKLQDLYNVLQDGLANLKLYEKLNAEFGAD